MGFSVFVTILLALSLSSQTVTPHHTPSLDRLQLNLTRTPYNMYYKLVVTISLGTPPVEVVLLMDTGSPLTWTQCQPCPGCFKQHPPYYNSATSKTFRKVPCGGGGRICKECIHNECVYNVSYGGNTSDTKGLAATETFSFSGGASAAGILFGCSKTATPISISPRSHVSGIMGLGSDPESVLTQMFPPQKRRFSYCVPRFSSGKVGSTTLMTFGDDVVVPAKITPATALRTTPFIKGGHHYNLNLLDISVGNHRLGFPAGTFGPSGWREVIIDSGTAVPIVPRAVIREFERHYHALGLKKIESPREVEGIEPCYRRPAGFRDYMNLTYHFQGGADYFVDGKYTSVVRRTRSFFCVALLPAEDYDLVVLGSWHQQNTRIVYDVSNGRLSFGPESC